MDFEEFEQLVLKVLFETDVPVTAAHVAYLGRVSVRTAEKHLARMVEHGTLNVRTTAAGVIEYVYPGRKPISTRVGADTSLVGSPANLQRRLVLPVAAAAPQPGDGRHALDADSGRRAHLLRRAGAGVAWMATTLMGYACCFLPGLFLHGLCLVSAAQTRRG